MNVRDELLGIRQMRGELTPQIVVDESRPTEAPLHEHFEWDDQLAGEAYRRQQASQLIRSVRVEYVRPTGEQSTVRAFHSVMREDARLVYDPVEEIAVDPIRRRLLLGQMERDWLTFRARYEHLAEFAELVATAVQP